MTTGAHGGGRQFKRKRAERRQEEEGDMHGKIGCKQGARGNLGGGREEGTVDISVEGKISILIIIGQSLVIG